MRAPPRTSSPPPPLTRARTGSPHQWLTNHLGSCAARATISTNARFPATVNGRMMYLSASYSATASTTSSSPFQVAQPSAAQRRSMCALTAPSCGSVMARCSASLIVQPPPSAVSSRKSSRAAISVASTIFCRISIGAASHAETKSSGSRARALTHALTASVSAASIAGASNGEQPGGGAFTGAGLASRSAMNLSGEAGRAAAAAFTARPSAASSVGPC